MATNKEQLLQYFRGLDISVLEKLQKYSKLLIIPDEDLLVNVTMSQMVDKAHSLADALFPEWTDRSKSDFGEFLVELFAFFSEKDFWYINAFANEGILSKMRSYSGAFSKAASMGYSAVTCKGSECNFSVSFEAGSETVYERGDLIIAVGSTKFTNDEAFTVGAAVTETTVQLLLHEGEQVAEDVTYNGHSIFIKKKNIDIDSIRLVLDNVEYTRVNNFGNSSSDSTHYMVLPEEEGSCTIYFGEDGFGVQPAMGKSIRVEYRMCSGASGNIQRGTSKVNDSLSSRKATYAIMLADAEGGHNADTLTAIKEKAPLFFSTKRAAINETSSQQILNTFTFVQKSKVVVLGREIIYRVIPTSGHLELTNVELKTLKEDFEPYIMLGYKGVYATNIYRSLLTSADPYASQIIIDAVILSGYSSERIESSIRQVMEDVTNPLIRAEYGSTFYKTDIDILMRSNIPGVQNIAFKIKVGTTEKVMPDVSLGETEIFTPIKQNEIIVRINVA